jgi:lipoate-protein ligase A
VHGEYKVPGGKLVTVELEVVDRKIARAQVAGDFFLEPEAALERINRALVGLSATSPVREIAAAVEAGLEPEDRLIGFTPRAIGFAIRRALGKATTWADHTFELIEDMPHSPALQMALDQVYLEALSSGSRGPTLRIWQWGSAAVVLGAFQSLSNEVDLEAAARHSVSVVRRISGGGTMFVEPGNTITYSLVVPGSLVDGLSFEESYEFLDQWVMVALSKLGIEARYAPLNDIVSSGGKIAGAAQKRLSDGTVLHHVTMAYDIDADKMLEVLRIGREKLTGKGVKSANKRVDPLRSQTGMSRDAIVRALIRSFALQYRLERSRVRPEEIAAAEHLVEEKFAQSDWTARIA